MGVQANQHARMILGFHQHLSILEKDSVMVLDRFPDPSEKADICQTKIHAHCHESLAATLASLQKVSHSPPNVIQRQEMLRRRSHGQRPSQPDLETKDQILQILETPLLGSAAQYHHSTGKMYAFCSCSCSS